MICCKDCGKIIYHLDNPNDYREFKNIEETRDWGFSNYSMWGYKYHKIMGTARSMSSRGFSTFVLECYCGYSYKEINSFLRTYDRNSANTRFDKTAEQSDILCMIIATAPKIPENIVVYRSVCDDFINELISNNRIGKSTWKKGFISTSMLLEKCEAGESDGKDNNILKIYLASGATGVYVNVVATRFEE